MFSTRPYLTRRCPSPTTVEYTVSNRPPPSLSVHLTTLFLSLARALILLSAAILLWAKSQQPDCTTGLFSADAFSSPALITGRPPHIPATQLPPCSAVPVLAAYPRLAAALRALLPRGADILDGLARAPLGVVLVGGLAAGYVALLRVHASESLLVLRGLGIQTSSIAAGSLVGAPASTRFIPAENIQDVLVNEAFRGFEVRHYLLIVVKGEEEVVVVFPKLLPGKNVVTTVWRGVKECLYEGVPSELKTRDI
ncbi:hypothetical protein TD95_002213 [Thielaviopsis punctulata]|uniref:Phosphatidylinositol N-acetylglucosaminyltransferase subunit H conserved domain-containing protein n=1 Tax=Thielaviopsis punctulata TaxID=72032 RepID=A0A0F4ZIB0_9PEZI|nr:hypothetical protein TD95_002213 [Thielaviopsis punctulata]